ncbi:MAG: aminotransferase class III-fold pyridoxal phosphate-dependent enzyme [Chloroflexi bacterium]|nr:aminotransferase class III-fold pyridoxal phosphate-dependent enzyme [Chloroflexota bacterium]
MSHAAVAVRPQADLLDRANRYLAGGGLGLFVLPDEVNLVIAEGHGSHVTDVSGRDFIDYHLGSGPALLGHAHPDVVAAVQEQLPKGSTYYFLNEPVIHLAEKIVEACPCADQVHFTGSGTEATFFALRVARAATGRDKVLKFEGGWHGMNDYGLWGTVPSQPSHYPSAERDSVGIPEALRGQVLVAPFNDAERAVQIIEQNASDLAAVIVEPLQRVLVPVPGFLEAVREVTRKHGIVLIYDEVVTGFRVAWGGAQERYGVVPDLATYGKAMSGGFPMAAIAGRAEIMKHLDARRIERARLVWASGTLNGNPISATAGLAALRVLERPGMYERLHRTGGRLRREITAIGARYGFSAQTPGEDAVFGVRFTDRQPLRSWEDLLTADTDLGRRWAIELIKRSILVNPNEKFYISTEHSEADVEQTLEAVDGAFAALAG